MAAASGHKRALQTGRKILMEIRASICAIVDNAGEVDEAERWLEQHQAKLTYVSKMNGCGCCVFTWDIQGPKDIIGTLPTHLSADGTWAASAPE